MAIRREFIGWDKPCLHEAATRLLKLSADKTVFDLHHITAVLPGGRAGRRLLELLLERAEADDKALVPPRIITTGQLPEALYLSDAPVLSDTQRLLLWMEALSEAGHADLKKVIPAPPTPDDFVSWHGLAEKVDTIYIELCGENLGFADMAEKCHTLPAFVDEERWEVLEGVFRRYLETCERHGALDLYAIRKKALSQNRWSSAADIYLVGCTDLNRMSRLMLDASAAPVVAFVPAPGTKSDHFDQYGCIRVDKWSSEKIELSDDQIEILQSPVHEADAAVRALVSWRGRYSAEDISFGVGDPGLAPLLMQRLEVLNIPAREASGIPLKSTAPLRFLEAVLSCLRSESFFDYATLLRHPAVYSWLCGELSDQGRGDVLSLLDHYQDSHLQEILSDSLPGEGEATHCAGEVMGHLRKLLSGLSVTKHTFSGWAHVVSDLLIEVFGQKPLRRFDAGEARMIKAMESLQEVLLEFVKAEKFYSGELPAAALLTFLLSRLSGQNIPYEGGAEEAIEVLGWLELALDDARAMLVSGFSEGLVPRALTADPFLPDSLRRAAGLLDNERRLARDAFSLTLISRSRSDLRICCSRTDARGEPRFPSRLLFACEENALAARVQAFQAQAAQPPALLRYPESRKERTQPAYSLLPIPLINPPAHISVTGFRDYIECPYRYYLKHILKLGSLDDCAQELDAKNFGILAHRVLRSFAKTPEAKSPDRQVVSKALRQLLAEDARATFGESPFAAVNVQLNQLEARLDKFSEWQATWVAQGWEIRFSEFSPPKVDLRFEGGGLGLAGQIDRVDFNSRTGEWAVFDYKTGDTVKDPEKMHRRKETWVDLQLPAYLYLLRKSEVCQSARCGYIALCSDADRIGALEANWSEEQLNSAFSRMLEIAENVYKQNFRPNKVVASEMDDYAVIYRALRSEGPARAGEL